MCNACEYVNGSVHDSGQGDASRKLASYNVYEIGTNNLYHNWENYNSPGYGFHIYSSGSTSVSGNVVRFSRIHDNGGSPYQGTSFGILLSSGTGNQAYGNLVYGNTRGIAVDYRCTNCLVYNNTVYNNNKVGSLGAQPDAGIRLGGSGQANTTGTIIRNNIVYGHSTNGIRVGSGSGTIGHNHCDSSATGCATTGNPLFVDAAGKNFALKLGSPAIDRGPALSDVPPYDISGTFRPLGQGWDIGAYESW